MPEKDMQILPEQGQFMQMLTKILQPKIVLEIGTYTGYSALCMALAAPNAKVTVLDVNEELTKIAEKIWIEAKVRERVDLIIAPKSMRVNKIIKLFVLLAFKILKPIKFMIYVLQTFWQSH